MHPLLRNSFMQMRHSDVNATAINFVIDDAMERPKLPYDLKPPLLTHPCSACQPCKFGIHPIPTRSRLAFLNWEIPQLINQLSNPELPESNKAIATLCDRLKNPELAIKALECHILDKVAAILRHRNKFMKSCAARLIETLAKHGGLAWQMVNMETILSGLVCMLSDVHQSVRSNAACAVEALTKIPWVADKMIREGFLVPLNTALAECINDLLEVTLLKAMENLAEREPDKCVELHILRDMTWKIKRQICDSDDEQVLSAALRVLAQLGRSKKGHEEADQLQTIKPIAKVLFNTSSIVYTSAAMALQALTLTTKSRWRSRQIHNLPTRLVYLGCKADNHHAQRYSLQVLNQLCELTPTRLHMLQYLDKIRQITTKNQLVEKTKNDLIQNILWDPFDYSVRQRTSNNIPSQYFTNKEWAKPGSMLEIAQLKRESRDSISEDSSLRSF